MKIDSGLRQQQALSIQSSGALLAFRPNDDKVALASANFQKFLGTELADGPIGHHVRDILGSEVFHALRNVISLPSILLRREHIGQHVLNERSLDISAYQTGDYVVAEMAEADSDPVPAAYDVLKDVLLLQDRIQSAQSDQELFQNIVMLLRAISGFDCVAACRYDENLSHIVANAGNVLKASETLETSDQLHAVPDIDDHCVGLQSVPDITDFDLALSGFRCVSTACKEKLRRVGATACATMGIPVQDRMWGYLVFLHRAPRYPNHRTRLALAHLSPFISARLNTF